MRKRDRRSARILLVAVMAVGAGAFGLTGTASARVTAVKGSAYGYFLDVSLSGTPQPPVGPTPTVTLPPGGAPPEPVTAPTGSASAGPAQFFSSGPISVSTQGTLGRDGFAVSFAVIENLNTSGQEPLTASRIQSSCNVNESTRNGSATFTDGTLVIDSGDDDPANAIPDHPPVTIDVPFNPPPNTSIEGHTHVNGTTESFRYVLNEQIANPDGSLTVNAAHQYLLGPTAVGDLIIGQTVCGLTSNISTTTTMRPTTTSSSTTTSTTTTLPPLTGPAGSAFGYSAPNIFIFGPQVPVGPDPVVTLPPGGSAVPITAHADSGQVRFGPAALFSSGPIDISTQGTSASVTSTAHIEDVPTSTVGEILYAGAIDSTCTATEAGVTGSTTITGPGDAGHTSATLRTSDGNPDVDGDETYFDIPLNPEPNLSVDGDLESVGDHFTIVFNEQIINSDGSITVYAVHEYLLGPTLTGDVYLGKVTCGLPGTVPTTTTTSSSTTTTLPPPTTTTTTLPPPTTTTTTTLPPPTTTTTTTLPPPTTTTSTTLPTTTTTTTLPPPTTTTSTTLPPTTTTTTLPPPTTTSSSTTTTTVVPPTGATCAGQAATIVGTPGPDDLTGTEGPDVIQSFGGDDSIDSLGGDDLICAGTGDDLVIGGAGNDTVDGGAGDDRVVGQSGRDFLRGSQGNDEIVGGSGNDALVGGPGIDDCNGGSGTNTFNSCDTKEPAPFGAGPTSPFSPAPTLRPSQL